MPTPRRSNQQHRLNGTYRADRHAPIPVQVEALNPDFPETLNEEHRAAWSELVDGCRPYLAKGDRPTVELAARLLTQSRSGAMKAAEATLLAKLLAMIGATPESRARLHPINAGLPAKNPFEDL
jgi:hypothetical protein